MEDFIQMTHDWTNFFAALAQISGALVGLVFVALTFNNRALGLNGNPMLGALARQTFADFITLLFISMMMLAPHLSAAMSGWVLLLLCAIGFARILGSLFRLRAHLRHSALLQRFVLSAAGHLMLGVAGAELVRGHIGPGRTGSLLLSGALMLMLSGCRSAWLLVLNDER